MARINFDDDVESKDEFWKLIDLVKDRDRAIGQLVRLFRLCQDHFGKNIPMTRENLKEKNLEHMIECGWVITEDSGQSFQVENPEKHFDWYAQKRAASKKGGEATRHKWEHIKEKRQPPGLPRPGPGLAPASPHSHAHSHAHNKKEESFEKSKKNPTLIANEILESVARFGSPNSTEARKSLGEGIWIVVKKFGGWKHICDSSNQGNLTSLRAQLRELATHI